ncbi:MAG: hypothetical protein ABF289_15720, partial [Clostridiales bacterium]
IDLASEEGFYNYYNTPYIIWSNKSAKEILKNDFKGSGPTISPNYLMNEFFNLAEYKGNEFIKLTDDLKESLDVIHLQKRYKENDKLTSKVLQKTEKELFNYNKVQYYLKTNFKNNRKK